jgi:hypothetical protein
MTGIPWAVRVDASTEPVTIVIAKGWYEARALASAKLNLPIGRLHVSQATGDRSG